MSQVKLVNHKQETAPSELSHSENVHENLKNIHMVISFEEERGKILFLIALGLKLLMYSADKQQTTYEYVVQMFEGCCDPCKKRALICFQSKDSVKECETVEDFETDLKLLSLSFMLEH